MISDTELIQRLRALECEENYQAFFEDAWKVIEPSTPLVLNWHIVYLCARLTAFGKALRDRKAIAKDVVINVPPGTSKSSLFTKIWPVWLWLLDPSLRIITGSYGSSLATTLSLKSRDILTSEWFQKTWGHRFAMKDDKNRGNFYENDKTGFRYAVGLSGSVTGEHAHVHIYDDPVKPMDTESPAMVRRAKKNLTETMATRFVDPETSFRILVMQRLSDTDPAASFLENEPGRWEHICLPGIVSDRVSPAKLAKFYRGGYLDPERYGERAMAKLRQSLGSYGFASQIMQDPEPEDGTILLKSWFGTWTYEELYSQARPEDVEWRATFDGAYTKDQANDPSAIFIYARVGEYLYVKHIEEAWLEFPELIQWLNRLNDKERLRRLYLEPKASGKSAAQQLVRSTKVNAILDVAPVADKVARAKEVSPEIEAGRVRLLEGAPWVRGFLSQVASFGTSATKDDQIDCLTMAVRREFLGVVAVGWSGKKTG